MQSRPAPRLLLTPPRAHPLLSEDGGISVCINVTPQISKEMLFPI